MFSDIVSAIKLIKDLLPNNEDKPILEDELDELESEARVLDSELKRLQVQEVNETMRAELVSGKLRAGWRPAYGYVTTLEFALWGIGTFCLVAYLIFTNHVAQLTALLNMLPDILGSFTIYAGIRFAVLGVAIGGRTREKITAKTGEYVPSVVEAITKTITK